MQTTLIETACPTNASRSPIANKVLMPAHDCWCPPAVDMHDVLRVDFSRTAIGPNGHYLIQIKDANGEWRGCRPFRRQELTQRIEMDVSGSGEWQAIASLEDLNIDVVGFVEQVYKPASASAAVEMKGAA